MTRGAKRKNETGLPVGIEARHARDCAVEPCTCTPSYRAWVYDRRTNTRIRKSFSGKGALAAAKGWRIDALSDLNRGKNIAPSKMTLRAVAEEWFAGAKATPPTVLNRSGEVFKPSAIRGYESDLRRFVLPEFGGEKLSEIRRGDLQRLCDKLTGPGLLRLQGAERGHRVEVGLQVGARPQAGQRQPDDGAPAPERDQAS